MPRKVKIKARGKQDDSQTRENIDPHTSAVIDLADSYHDFLEPGLFVRARSNILPDDQEQQEDSRRFRIQPGRCRMMGNNFLHKKNYILDNIPHIWTEFLNDNNLRKSFPRLYDATLHNVWDWKTMSKRFGATKNYENWIVALMNNSLLLKSKEYRDISLRSDVVKEYLYSHTDKTKGSKKLQNMALVDALMSYDILRNTDLKLIEHTSSFWDAANKPKGAEFVSIGESVRPPGETGKYVSFSDTHVNLHDPKTEKTWTIPINQLKTLRISVRSLCSLMESYENKKDAPRTIGSFVTSMIKETLTCEKSSFLNHKAKTQKKPVKKTGISSPGASLVGFLLKNNEIEKTETKEKKRKTDSAPPFAKSTLNIPRVLDIKRSGDYGQIAIIKKLYDGNFTKMIKNNKESFIRHYLLTNDRLCYLRAKLENAPAILVKNDGTINIYPGDLVDTIQYKKYIEERQQEIWDKRTQVAHLYKLYQKGQLFDPDLTSYYKAQNFHTLYDTFVDPINEFSQVRDTIKSAVMIYPEAESFLGIFDKLVQTVQHVQQTLIRVISDIFAFFSRREDIMEEFVAEIDTIINKKVTSLKQVETLSPKDTEEIHERLSQVLTYLEFITRTFRFSIQPETIYTTPEKIDFIRISTPIISTQANACFVTAPVNKKKNQGIQDDAQRDLRVLRDLGLDNLQNFFRVPVQYIPTSFEQITMDRPFCKDDITHPTSLTDEMQKILATMFSFFPDANAFSSSSSRRQRVLPRLTVITLQQSRLLLEKKAQTMLNALMDKVDDHAFLIFHSPFQENDDRARRQILNDDMGVEQSGSSASTGLTTLTQAKTKYFRKNEHRTSTKKGRCDYYLSPRFREGIFHDFIMAWTEIDTEQKVILSDWTCFVCVLSLMHDVISNNWDMDNTVSYDEIHQFFYARVQNMMKDILHGHDTQAKHTLNDAIYGNKKKISDIKKDILQIPFIKKERALREFWTFMLESLYK